MPDPKGIFMEAPTRLHLHRDGDNKDRIGPENKRNSKLSALNRIEDLIDEHLNFPLGTDCITIEPPFFKTLNYYDVLGGIQIGTASAEINWQLAQKLKDLPASRPFPIHEVGDKYELKPNPDVPKFKKVIMLPGSNLFQAIDQSKLIELLKDPEWVIKPHPVTNRDAIRDIANFCGYERIMEIDNKISGHDVFNNAEEIATLQSSEFSFLARMKGKKFVDLTRLDVDWLLTYHSHCSVIEHDDKDAERITNIMMHECSGFLHPTMEDEEIIERIKLYMNAVFELREPYRMHINQKLSVSEYTLKDWLKTPFK